MLPIQPKFMATKTPWQLGKSLTNCLQYALEQEVDCDVTFQIQFPGRPHATVSARKWMLSIRSPVFERMFSGDFKEASENIVEIKDIDIDTFKSMLRYIYTDDVEIKSDNVLHIDAAARKYMLQGLTEKCSDFLAKMTNEDACSVLTHSIQYKQDDLIKKCLKLVAADVKAVVKMNAFYRMSHEALLKFTKCAEFARDLEVHLFEACLEWAKRRAVGHGNTDSRTVLGECLHHIKFPSMSAEEFANACGDSTILSESEKNSISFYLLTKKKSYLDALIANGFDLSPRTGILSFKRYNSEIYGSSYEIPVNTGKAEERFTFSVDTAVYFLGISVYGGKDNARHCVIMTLTKVETKALLSKYEGSITCARWVSPVPVFIDKKVHLEAGIDYELSVKISGKTKTGYGYIEEYRQRNYIGFDRWHYDPERVIDGVRFRPGSVSQWPHTMTLQTGQHDRQAVNVGYVPQIHMQKLF